MRSIRNGTGTEGSCGVSRGRRLPLLGVTLGAALAMAGLSAAAGSDDPASVPGDPLNGVLTELEPAIERAMLDGNIPSLTMALVDGEEIIWSGGFGKSNRWARTPAVPGTVYIVASTLKPQATFALLQLHEHGRFQLDDPVSDHLGGLEIGGEDPDDPITFRHLLTHTSGLPTAYTSMRLWDHEVPMSPREYLEDVEVEGPPMERVRYSNPGYTLIAHLIEEMTDRDFRDVVREEVWEPLGMDGMAFRPDGALEERLAQPYAPAGNDGGLRPVSRTRFHEWPAGGAYGTVEDQARFLAVNLTGGIYDGRRLLEEETVDRMHTRQFQRFAGPMRAGWGGEDAGYGLTWWTSEDGAGHRIFAHSGSIQGYTAFLHGNRDRQLGVAILTNGNRAHDHLVELSELATELMTRHLRAD